jgi:hypothetical protein
MEPTPSITNGENDQFQLALSKVVEEFRILTAGKPNMTVKETIELREYITKRTDLKKSDEELTPDQKAWKHLYYIVDKQLAKSLGKDEKEKLDNLRLQLDQLNLIEQHVHELFLMGRQIEEVLIQQRSYLNVHFDRNMNTYRQVEEKMSDDMLAESTPNPRRIEIARSILKIVDTYKQLMDKNLFETQDKIYELLSRFTSIYKQIPFPAANGDERISKIERLYGEWLFLTEQVHKERLKVITAVRNTIEADTLIPNHIIRNNGDKTVNIPMEELASKLAAAEVLLKDGHSKEHEIADKRDQISLEAFGDPNSYINVKQEEALKEPKKEGWFRVIKKYVKGI